MVQFGAAAYSPAADWWGLGVLIYELLLGLVPWDGSDADAIMDQIKVADVVWPPEGMVSAEDRASGAVMVGACWHSVCWWRGWQHGCGSFL